MYIYTGYNFQIKIVILSMMICLSFIANSVDPDEMSY